MSLASKAKPLMDVANALGTSKLQPVTVMPGYTAAKVASRSALGFIGTAAAIGAAAIAQTAARGNYEEDQENINRDTPAIGLGSGKKMKKQTTRRILRATGELSM
jgi:hypothetical protein